VKNGEKGAIRAKKNSFTGLLNISAKPSRELKLYLGNGFIIKQQ
jgi:hypothetical protein